ncbi:MAG: ATP-binding protein [candidate division Zixibacteria bacterium]|nr:ATP-binding protein [candidate division Zixibacteria bacterium]MDD5427342.1 ATP-binding protein [candidate division Zixibacteria bacterium]
MHKASKPETAGLNQRFILTIFITLALAVFVIAWISIRASRSDSFELLVLQGTAFTEALAQAAENALKAETFYDHLVQKRYSDLVGTLLDYDLEKLTELQLVDFALNHDIYGIYVYGMDSNLFLEGYSRGPRVNLPEFVIDEVEQLIRDPQTNYVLLHDEEGSAGGSIHYYLELTNRLDYVVVLVAEAAYYSEALRQTGIGYLAQKMAREKDVRYIIYQTREGIIFASRKPGNLLAIESDPFLSAALDSDSIRHRVFTFQEEKVLELVRPFASVQYPFGLFRVGMSLEKYYAVSRRFDQQMIILSGVLFILLVVAILYINSKRRRMEISLKYTEMKTITDKIFEQMQTGVAVVDAGGMVRLANVAFERIFGLSDITGKSWRALVSVPELSLESFITGSREADEIEITREVRNETREILIARSRIISEEAGLTSVVMVAYDISSLKAYERQAARRERLSEMGNLAAGVAHEIRNPLNTISIAAQRLASEFSPGHNQAEYLSFTEKIRNETKRLNDIITRFLALAREEKKNRTIVYLDRLIGEFTEFIRAEADKLQIEIVVDAESEMTMKANPDQIKQIFQNLYNNTKEALNGQAGKFLIKAEKNNGKIIMRFSDNGPGIEPELREKVLSPYFTTKDGGTGLGLPTVYKIVSDLDGEMNIKSGTLGGTDVIISFPETTRA